MFRDVKELSPYTETKRALQKLGYKPGKRTTDTEGKEWVIMTHSESDIVIALTAGYGACSYYAYDRKRKLPVSYHTDTKTSLSWKGTKWLGFIHEIQYDCEMSSFEEKIAQALWAAGHYGHCGLPVKA